MKLLFCHKLNFISSNVDSPPASLAACNTKINGDSPPASLAASNTKINGDIPAAFLAASDTNPSIKVHLLLVVTIRLLMLVSHRLVLVPIIRE
ncbi:hypothetical protein [Ancylothrix sp. D3o]|uniref:hypothetical protein n=1 Tax=Ancylothrix sp. D3o TaxID=2953691 RepID=UPI0021BB3829|nr:hypothetical protein [Ancylothrix sp. D3o]